MASLSENDRCTVRAPAKLNLCLELLGPRPDGFNELRTVMTTVRLGDTLRLDARQADDNRLTLSVEGDATGAPTDRTNLVIKALEALRAATGCGLGATARLVKRTPSEAGLGGGSSDAAAALVAADTVWGLGLPVERLAQIGASVGSDVPFFVHAIAARRRGQRAEAALCEGRGERVRPVRSVAGAPVVIVKPNAGLATAEVFRACQPEDRSSGRNLSGPILDSLAKGDWSRLGASLHNGLGRAAASLSAEVARLVDWLGRAPVAGGLMSGSGAACFAICRSNHEARRIATVARAARLGRVWATTTG